MKALQITGSVGWLCLGNLARDDVGPLSGLHRDAANRLRGEPLRDGAPRAGP
jgi:hypothetical protein